MTAHPLAKWILHSSAQPVTHLALQKLVFYCYGAALAFDQEGEFGLVSFEAWKHGPVNRELWQQFRELGRETIARDALGPTAPAFCHPLASTLQDALAVYGSLDAWSLREQSHLEAPWKEARKSGTRQIDHHSLKVHFTRRFRQSPISAPDYFIGAGIFTLDGVPAPTFGSFRELADAARRAASAA